MKKQYVINKTIIISMVCLLTMVCGTASAKRKPKGQITPDQLYIVDCLLPPQIRQLGRNHTYMAPRKPARLSAHDCALRGGEYVAYDKASFSSIAKMWLPEAQGGNPKAQAYMGEIYEKGVNGTPDYQSAVHWYQKAVDQGYTPAMLNLGNLYEQGLGVEQDSTKAINLYRMASGITDSKIEIVTEQNLRERRAKEHQRIKLLKQVTDLRQQLSEVKKDYDTTKRYVAVSDEKLKLLEKKLIANKQDKKILKKIAELKTEIKAKNVELANQNKVIDTLVTKVTDSSANVEVVENTTSGINLLSPDVVLTRGIKTIPMQPNDLRIKIWGTVDEPESVIGLKMNSKDIMNSMTENGVFEDQMQLLQGDTPVSIVAIRENGKKSIEQFVAVRNKFDPVEARHLDELFTRRFRKDLGDYYALVIGNNNYKDSEFENLKTAVADAKEISTVLKKKYGYKVKLLIDADEITILKALTEYQDKLGKYDNLMVYYAGHGLVDDKQQGYWIPTDAKLNDKSKWISNKNISDFMSEMKAKHVMVVADSCYSGTLTGSSISPLPENVENDDILFTSRVKARTVLTSGGLQPVLDSGGNGHSIFASAFLDVLNENDGVMEGYRLYKAMSQQVSLRSSLAGFKQVPEYSAIQHAGHEGSEYYFLPTKI